MAQYLVINGRLLQLTLYREVWGGGGTIDIDLEVLLKFGVTYY